LNNSQSTPLSNALFERSIRVLPGGVNSPVRAFRAVGGTPRFMARGAGSHIWDVDGNKYIDYVMSWGPLIHGHAFPPVVQAIHAAAHLGTSFGAPTENELLLAEEIIDAIPSIEMLRLVSSGTEATMSAIRLARAYTERDLIVKFSGNYHGHADMLLAQAGSGGLTLGVPSSPGVPAAATAYTLIARYNDTTSVEALFERYPGQIAAVIVEPIAGNMGVVAPTQTFLPALRRITDDHGALLILDEVITGFRVSRGGAQSLYSVVPDLTTLGKIIGGGLPVGAYGGRREIMEKLSPVGPVYQAGTLSGNPLATAAGIATLLPLRDEALYLRLNRATTHLAERLRAAAHAAAIPVTVNAVTGMLTLFFANGPVKSLDDVQQSDTERHARFFHAMLDRGISLPPSQFEAWMLSNAHSEADIDSTIIAAQEAFSELR
jgi:glutamate-1-semialdehyde 2,1-aminomutase